MQSDYEIEAHVAYRIASMRNTRRKTAVESKLARDNKPLEPRRRPMFGLPRLVRRPM
jgi:hypothetical protein